MKPPFEQVVERHGPTVWRVCRAIVGPVDADDAWSETFLSALRAYPDLPADANLEAWLVTIAHRRAIDAHRARSRRAVPVPDVGHEAGPGATLLEAAAATTGADAFIETQELYAALARLPERQRHAVAYHHLAGLPHAQVAQIIGGTPAAVRRASADGIASLRRALGQPGGATMTQTTMTQASTMTSDGMTSDGTTRRTQP